MIKIHLIAGARPNFMKIAPLYHALKKEDWADTKIIHTGQHYDSSMSSDFFDDLNLPDPDYYFGVGSGGHAEQTTKTMIACERLFIDRQPNLIIVVGDVNSTLAAALAASKLGIKLAHLEAGLRAYDRSLPEEINRIVTDVLCDILWPPSIDGTMNLMKEGVSQDKIDLVGNIMIDSLEMMRERIEQQKAYAEFNVEPNNYGLVTLHRPANVDDPDTMLSFYQVLSQISTKIPLIFPAHPRTQIILDKMLAVELKGLQIIEPLGYIDFMSLMFNSRFVITDSGGVQEETSYLGIPCVTIRPNTERPITISLGTNRLCHDSVDSEVDALEECVYAMMREKHMPAKIEMWDGQTANRVVRSIYRRMM